MAQNSRQNLKKFGRSYGAFNRLINLILDMATASAVAWSIDAGILAAFGSAVSIWNAAYAAGSDRLNRTKAQVLAMSNAKKTAMVALIDFVNYAIRFNPAISDEELVQMNQPINLTAPNTKGRVKKVLNQKTQAQFTQLTGGEIKITLRSIANNSNNGTFRGKGLNVAWFNVYYKTGLTTNVVNPDLLTMTKVTQHKANQTYNFASVRGEAVSFYFQSVSGSGLTGDLSPCYRVFIS